MKYGKYLLIVLLFSLAVLSGIHLLYRGGYKRFYAFEMGKLHEIIKGKEKFDVVFIGSSRTFYHINPKVTDSVTGLNTYNAGVGGANLHEMNMVLQAYLASHAAPKLVVLEIAAPAFAIDYKPIFNPNLYYPFLANDAIFNGLKPYKRAYLLKYLPFLQITEADDVMKQAALYGYLNKKSVKPKDTYKGYQTLGNATLRLPLKNEVKENYAIEPKGVQLLQEVLQTCKEHHSKVVVTYPPQYGLTEEDINPQFFPTITKWTQAYKVPFWNYKDSQFAQHPELFKDEWHLNAAGADLFSAVLANDINAYLKGI